MASFVAKYQIAIVICWIRPVLNATKLEIRYRQTRFFLDFANDGGNNTLSTFDMALLCQATDTIYLLDFITIISQSPYQERDLIRFKSPLQLFIDNCKKAETVNDYFFNVSANYLFG